VGEVDPAKDTKGLISKSRSNFFIRAHGLCERCGGDRYAESAESLADSRGLRVPARADWGYKDGMKALVFLLTMIWSACVVRVEVTEEQMRAAFGDVQGALFCAIVRRARKRSLARRRRIPHSVLARPSRSGIR
jgi:hypothetical protein